MESDQQRGTAAVMGVTILLAAMMAGCNGVEQSYRIKVAEEFSKQPVSSQAVLTEADIAPLPSPVRRYIAYTGAVGKRRPQTMRLLFDAQMTSKPGASPMDATSEQYNFFKHPTRLFYMKASKYLVPFRVLHAYTDEKATMLVRVASLFNAVDLSGKDLTTAETVTLLNDMCVFAPGNLIDKRFAWKEIDSLTAGVTFTNGQYTVSALLYFNAKGELIDFTSEDRMALQEDGTLRKALWSTPLRDYKEFDGRKVPTYGEALWKYPEANFTYGTFTVKNVEYDIKEYQER